MLRFLSIMLLCLGLQLRCFSAEKHQENWNLKECLQRVFDNPAFSYLGVGNLNILLKDFPAALDAYNKAMTYIDPLSYYSPFANFLILFGRIVAYDNLGMRQKAEEDIGRLILLAQEFPDDEDEEEDEEEDEICEVIDVLMAKIASLAISEDIKNFLLSIIDEEDEDIGAEKI